MSSLDDWFSDLDDNQDDTSSKNKPPVAVIKSVYENQTDILKGIMTLYAPDGFDCDVTYGNGKFYKDLQPPNLKFDIDPQLPEVIEASSNKLPIADQTLKNVVFDPPFLTYVRAGRGGNGNMIMAKRFSGYWKYDELEEHYKTTLKETARVLIKGGFMIFKCQDIVHNHKLHCTHANVITWADEVGLRLQDLFILPAKHRMPSPNRGGSQKHARIFHSYFLVLQKK